MKRITLIAITTIFAVLLFGVSSFAANNIASDAVNGVRNVVGGAENILGGAVSSMTNGVRNGMSAIGNTVEDDDNRTHGAMTTDNNNGGYNATRTTTRIAATDTANTTFLGMSATAWGWFIMATVGIVTVALVWYYGKQHDAHYNQDDNY